jgi:hypothetical protein
LPELERHLAYLEAELEAAIEAPLSRRRATLVAALADAFADRLFATSGEDDILVFRTALAKRSAELGIVFAICADHVDGPRVVTEAVEIPIADYGTLPVADFMVSLYNGHTVQRVLVALPDGSRRDAHEVLEAAVAALKVEMRR